MPTKDGDSQQIIGALAADVGQTKATSGDIVTVSSATRQHSTAQPGALHHLTSAPRLTINVGCPLYVLVDQPRCYEQHAPPLNHAVSGRVERGGGQLTQQRSTSFDTG